MLKLKWKEVFAAFAAAMTNRERLARVFSGGPLPDRFPALEWASWWDKTLEGWHAEGLPKGMTDRALYDFFELDDIRQFWFPHKSPGCPQDVSHGSGIMETEEDYERIKPFLYPADAVARMLPEIHAVQPLHTSGETIVWYTLEGFFWWPRVLFGIENHLYSFYDCPKLYHRICEDLLEWQLIVVEEFAQYLHADFMTIAEDMSYNNGPMISQALFDEFVKPYYERLITAVKKHGTRVFIDSDGDVSIPVNWFLNAGADGVLPLERQAGVDVARLQANHPTLLMLGGFDKMCMLQGQGAIRAEFERLAPAIRAGRYLPAMDHQTPPGVTMENYRFYVKLLKEYTANP